MHHRMKPKIHRFAYDVFSCLLDLDRLAEADRASPFFSVDRFNLIAFHQGDYGEKAFHGLGGDAKGLDAQAWPDPEKRFDPSSTSRSGPRSLATYAREKLAAADVQHAGDRILLLAYPRVLGFVFNPLSIYYCFAPDGTLGAMIYEVSNTFGGRHTYVAPVRPGEMDDSGLHQDCAKAFYVSPFLDMPLRYKFRLAIPDAALRFRILEEDAVGPILAATFSARRQPFSTKSLLRAFAGLPLMTAKVVFAIHWEALRLWLKGVRLVPKPKSIPPAASAPVQRGAS